MHHSYRVNQLFAQQILEQIARCSGLEGAKGLNIAGRRRQNYDDARMGKLGSYRSNGIDPIDLGS